MINHARKLMAMILLMNLQEETGAFIPESYNGFRAGRSTDDTLTALLLGMTYLKEMGYEVMLLFLDLEGAFDKCSWRGIDTAMAAAGASAKSRAMFRTLYRTAQGIARVRKEDGETVDSNPYDIRKSVLQGDTLSPYLFILLCVYALNMTLTASYRKTHSDDNNFCITCAAGFYRAPEKRPRLQCGVCRATRHKQAHVEDLEVSSDSDDEPVPLPYFASVNADDFHFFVPDADQGTPFVNQLSQTFKETAGQKLSTEKTKTMVCRPKIHAGKSTIDDQILLNNKYPCNMCGKREHTKEALRTHQMHCKKRKEKRQVFETNDEGDIVEFKIARIVRMRGLGGDDAEGQRFLQVVWYEGVPNTDSYKEWEWDIAGDDTADYYWERQCARAVICSVIGKPIQSANLQPASAVRASALTVDREHLMIKIE